MDGVFRVGVFSPNDPRPWVRSGNLDMMLTYEGHLVKALRERGIEVVRGGAGLPREAAWSPLVEPSGRRSVTAASKMGPAVGQAAPLT